MNSKPILLLDFDGVLNFFSSSSGYKKAKDTAGYVKQTTLIVNGEAVPVSWPAESVKRLNDLKRTTGYEWKWLSTWRSWTTLIDDELGTRSDGFVSWKEADGKNYPGYNVRESYGAKLAHVLRINDEDKRPFVWVDDEATDFFSPDQLSYDVPHLIIKPDEKTGMTRTHLTQIEKFMREHS